MERNWYFVELGYIKQGFYSNVEPLTFEKLHCYIMDSIKEHFTVPWHLVDFSQINKVQFFKCENQFIENQMAKISIYFVNAISEEEALGKVIITNYNKEL